MTRSKYGRRAESTPEQRKILFWKKVNKTETCWLWTGSKGRFGHGRFKMNGGRLGTAHRVSWVFSFGEIPPSLCCLHKCDVPNCVNPAHLFLGTHADNVADKCAKGRQSFHGSPGMKNPNAKLTDDSVREIRKMGKAGATDGEIAEKFGVKKSAVYHVLAGRSWKHV